jgi:uncharacterized phage-associated protein
MDRVKFENAVLYLLHRCSPTRPSLTSLLKMIYLSDYEHYRQFLAPITDTQYVALERGPVVDDYKRIFSEMVEAEILTLHESSILGRKEKKSEYQPVMEPDVSVFSSSELGVMDSVAEKDGTKTGVFLSEKTHLEGPWQYVWDWRDPGQPIPYLLFRWVDNLPTDDDLERAADHVSANQEIQARIEELQTAASS